MYGNIAEEKQVKLKVFLLFTVFLLPSQVLLVVKGSFSILLYIIQHQLYRKKEKAVSFLGRQEIFSFGSTYIDV